MMAADMNDDPLSRSDQDHLTREAVRVIGERFESMNGVPVTVARITADEFAAIRNALAAPDPVAQPLPTSQWPVVKEAGRIASAQLDYYREMMAASAPVAQVWAEGYPAGINDERTSEASIGIAGFGAKVQPARNNPYGAATAPVALCGCGDRPSTDCPGEWEPGCDLGENEAHVVVVPASTAAPAPVAQPADMRSLAQGFEVTGPDADGLLWLVLHGLGTTGKAMFNLGAASRVAGQVALLWERDRRAALVAAPAPVAQPLTDEALMHSYFAAWFGLVSSDTFTAIVRWAERAHDIKATGQEGGAA